MFLPDNSIFTPVVNPNMDPNRTPNQRLAMRPSGSPPLTRWTPPTPTNQALNEASRCLKCPTHWCQKACPAGVPVTDFIAKVPRPGL